MTVLICDDDANDSQLLGRLVGKLLPGARIITVATRAGALCALVGASGTPDPVDIALLDARMPAEASPLSLSYLVEAAERYHTKPVVVSGDRGYAVGATPIRCPIVDKEHVKEELPRYLTGPLPALNGAA